MREQEILRLDVLMHGESERYTTCDGFNYPNVIRLGAYKTGSTNIPDKNILTALIRKAVARISAERVWVNPDSGLKARNWVDVLQALKCNDNRLIKPQKSL